MILNKEPYITSREVTFTPAQGFSLTESLCYRVGDMLFLEGTLSTPAIAARSWVTAGTFNVNTKAGSRALAMNENGARRIFIQSTSNGIQVFNTASEQVANDYTILFMCQIQ